MKTTEKNYRIFRVEEIDRKWQLPKKITMKRIYAKDNNDAYDQLKEYIKVANKEYKYYVEAWQPYIIIRGGKKHVYDDIFDELQEEEKEKPLFKRILSKIQINCWRYFIDKPKNCYYFFRDVCYLLKYKQQYHSSWCIDEALLDVLSHNIPILKKYKHCLSWKMLDKVILEKNKDVKNFDLDKFYEEHCQGFGDEIENEAVRLEKEMFDKLIDDIKAYRYYMGDYQWIDKNDKDLIETDKKLRSTLPLIKGSYDKYDVKKLNALTEKYWNRIWETVRIYGREFID